MSGEQNSCPPSKTSCGNFHVEEEGSYPYSILNSPEQGNYLVASRDVAAGEVLFRVDPLVVGPNQDGSPICLACLCPVDCTFLCPRCTYPMCDQECADDPNHKEECSILAQGTSYNFFEGEVQEDAYHAILPLRMLLLLAKGGPEVKMVEGMVDHMEQRRGGEYWRVAEEQVVDRLREGCGQEQWGREEVQGVVGRLELNCYEVHSYVTAGIRACFPLAFLVNHSCVANSTYLWTKAAPFTATLLAARAIPAGEAITANYQPTVTCSLLRQRKLTEGWFFQCQCPRCKDPKELGAHTNTLRCPACHAESLLPTRPQDWGAPWACAACGAEQPAKVVEATVGGLLAEVNQLVETDRYNTEAWLEVRERAMEHCHPRHHVCCEVAKWLVPILCRGRGKTLADFPEALLEIKATLARDYLAVLNIVEPGLSRNRAKTIFEKVDTSLYLSSIDFREGIVSRKELEDRLRSYDAQAGEAEEVLARLGANSAFEQMVVFCLGNIRKQCQQFLLAVSKPQSRLS